MIKKKLVFETLTNNRGFQSSMLSFTVFVDFTDMFMVSERSSEPRSLR